MFFNQKKKIPFSSVDTAWLRMEDPTNLMMVTGVLLFDEPLDFPRFRATIEHRWLKYNRFRMRVVNPKAPHWEMDPHFDLNAHLHRIALPAPGDQAALQDLVSDLMSTPLDFSKPLWQFHLVENYGQGCALVGRFHHCVADGIAMMHVLLSMTDTTANAPWPTAEASEKKRQNWNPLVSLFQPAQQIVDRSLALAGTLWQEGVETLANPMRAADLAKLGISSGSALGRLLLLWPDPKTVFKGKLGVPKRAVWTEPIPLDDVKVVGKVLGGTVNDVLLTAVTGALRRYLIERGEKVDGVEFRAVVPVNLRPTDQAPELGNRFGLVFLSLPVGIGDLIERMFQLKERMDAIKDTPEAAVAYGILNGIGMSPLEVQNLVVSIFGLKATAVMTNVPGPRETIYLAGQPVKGILFWVPQSGRLGLGVSIFSYARQVTLGIATDTGLVPDPEGIIAGFREEFREMAELAHEVMEADKVTAQS
ncbi:MAG: wax ester/triacylglycerol synthase family O-acyltransferase [Chloroflexi bacterium]|nr:wax ester/triacylglycerol synthase family O-acyltransferase [Chloroflexota bacterium]